MGESSEVGGRKSVFGGDLEESDLPRIVVTDDSIFVEDNDWVKKDVVSEEVSGEDEVEEKLVEGDLEEIVGNEDLDTGEDSKDELYKVGSRVDDFYSSGSYDARNSFGDYENSVKAELVDLDEERVDRSMLEIAGFRDEEAKKKRKEKRERIW